MPFDHARTLVRDHVIWSAPKHEDNILISFTSSFLYALQRCMYQVYHEGHRAEYWYIRIVDTSKFPPETWHSTPRALKKYDLGEKDHKYLASHYHATEYLAEYEVMFTDDSRCSKQVSFQQLLDAGLYKLAPRLNSSPHKRELIIAVNHLRRCHNPCNSKKIETEDVLLALCLGTCFGDSWLMPMAVWGLALERRPDENKRVCEILGIFHRYWSGMVPYEYAEQD